MILTKFSLTVNDIFCWSCEILRKLQFTISGKYSF